VIDGILDVVAQLFLSWDFRRPRNPELHGLCRGSPSSGHLVNGGVILNG
jgi:hypothetical protein